MSGSKILGYNFWVLMVLLIITQQTAEGCVMCFAGKQPENLGVHEGKLASCPSSPNCVSSFAEGSRFISPLKVNGSGEVIWEGLIGIVKGMKRTTIVTQEKHYLHAEFASAVFGFVDDVEFLLDEDKKLIHVRSASRLGYSDFGVNRKRIEEIRSRLNERADNK